MTSPNTLIEIEITGWDAEGEPAEALGIVHDNETIEEAITRLAQRWWIVEIGDIRVTGGAA